MLVAYVNHCNEEGGIIQDSLEKQHLSDGVCFIFVFHHDRFTLEDSSEEV